MYHCCPGWHRISSCASTLCRAELLLLPRPQVLCCSLECAAAWSAAVAATAAAAAAGPHTKQQARPSEQPPRPCPPLHSADDSGGRQRPGHLLLDRQGDHGPLMPSKFSHPDAQPSAISLSDLGSHTPDLAWPGTLQVLPAAARNPSSRFKRHAAPKPCCMARSTAPLSVLLPAVTTLPVHCT